MIVLIFITSLLGLMALGMPVAFSLVGCGLCMMYYMGMTDPQLIIQNMWDGANSFPLLAVPFFMLAGELMNAGGMSRRIVEVAQSIAGHVRGGLGYVAIIAATIVASISGSAVADSAAVAALLIPMMRSAGYNVPRSAGLIASAGIIAPIIPPSIAFVAFGVTTQLSITKLFMAGIVPGLLWASSLTFTWWLVARKEAPTDVLRFDAARLGRALRDGVWALVLPVVIIGGMKFGVFTPTEAAVVAVFYALAVSLFIYRSLSLKDLPELLLSSLKTASSIMFLVACAVVSAWRVTGADIPAQMSGLLRPFMDSPTTLLVIIMILVLLIGTSLDLIPTVLILGPILVPVVKQAGIDPIYFGVLFIMNVSIGMLTPPVGTVLNVVAGVSKAGLGNVIKGVWPFLIAETVMLFLLVLFPSLVTVPMRWLS